MNWIATHLRRTARLPHIGSLLLLSAAAVLHAQSVPNVTGTMTSQFSSSRYGHGQSISMQLAAGANFSLNAMISSDDLLSVSPNAPVVTFYPAAVTSDYMPEIIAADPGSNYGTLIYNGVSYTNLQIQLNIKGAPASVADVSPNLQQFYGGNVAAVPFSLSGVVTAYSGPPNPNGTQTNPALFSVSFSGGGLYNAGVSGSLPASGSPAIGGQSTYQLVANPIGFSTDATTQGTWSGVYGGEGYLIANGPSVLPGYAAVSVTQATTYTWANLTSDVRALQNGFGATGRLASSYTSSSFNINLNFTDGNPHPVGLYLLDFDNGGRSETLTVKNADTGAVLDTETISNFQNGVYAVWNLQGNVTINVKRASGANPVVSGIFFGPPATILNANTAIPSSTATFFGTNTAIQGAWAGHYGSSGYLIANGPSFAPTVATMNVAGAFMYTWAGQTSDPRALQTTGQSSSGLASAYTQYGSNRFKINIDSPIGTKEVLNLYLLDWDNEGRVETITITDMGTGAVLDTETASSFQGGVYYSWLISGNVVVTVTPSGYSSPVVSGIFLN